MTTISAKMVADSISPEGIRLSTMHLRYPRFIHAEFMTHRVFSRNARSSRAVPVPKMIEEIRNDPVIPIHWGKAQKGMQAYEENNDDIDLSHGLDVERRFVVSREEAWLHLRDQALGVAQAFHQAGYHKQVINRLLEPFMHIDTLVTATEWDNFLLLRDHHAAEPHIQVLAQAVRATMDESHPEPLDYGDWHLPYITEEDTAAAIELHTGEPKAVYNLLIKLSVARCARISYEPFDGDASLESELRRYDLLVGSHPIHASPAEHQAAPDRPISFTSKNEPVFRSPELHGNFRGWVQYRKTLAGEDGRIAR